MVVTYKLLFIIIKGQTFARLLYTLLYNVISCESESFPSSNILTKSASLLHAKKMSAALPLFLQKYVATYCQGIVVGIVDR